MTYMTIKTFKNAFFGLLAASMFSISAVSCGGDDDAPQIPGTDNNTQEDDEKTDAEFEATFSPDGFARGADISWVTELESKGYKFYSKKGREMELTKLLRNTCGVNAIRLRVWVNPENGWNGVEDVLEKARRARDLRMRLMVDFHFSDSWADPGQQHAPAAWIGKTPAEAATAVSQHVSDVLGKLKNEGIDVEWVQIGNETTPGMMHELGGEMKGNSAGEFPCYLNAGYDAVKSVFPQAKVIVHLDRGQDKAQYKWFFDLLNANGGKYDMIGMSLYPETESGSGSSWSVNLDYQAITNCLENIKELNQKYGKKIILSEIGFHYTNSAGAKSTLRTFLREFGTADILDGVFYWEPEAPEQEGYKKGAFDNNRPTQALDPFLEATIKPAQ